MILLYERLQSSVYPLQGCVFVVAGAPLVEVVARGIFVPTRRVAVAFVEGEVVSFVQLVASSFDMGDGTTELIIMVEA